VKLKITISTLLLLTTYFYAQVPLSSLSRTRIKYGEPVVLRVQVQVPKTDNVVFPLIKDTITYHLEVLGRKKDTLIQEGKYLYIDSITFSGYEEGTFTVPPQRILINSKEYFTPSYKITVSSAPVDSLQYPLYDIRPIITEPKIFRDYFEQYWLYMIMGATILIVAVILAVLYYLERKKKKSDRYTGANPDVLAIKKLQKLEKSGYLDKGLSKKYYSEMVSILKEYMEARWKFPATKLLSDDLIDYLKDKSWIDQKEENDLNVIFRSADLAKFAKSRPSVPETKVHTEIAKKFINETKTEFYNLREQDEY
jgi:hypothetical protein